MKLLFVADPLESFKTHKDSTFAMMREAARRGHTLMACEPKDLRWQRGEPVTGFVRDITLTGRSGEGVHDWFASAQQAPDERPQPLCEVDAVLMRKDPPFDAEYFYATHLLSQAEREGARVFNKASALREHPEKLAILEFPQFIGPTLVTRDAADVTRFHAEHHDIILKPLDGMGGMGIFRVGPDGLNLGSITETLNRHGTQSLMVQKFLPEIVDGDKRVLVIGGGMTAVDASVQSRKLGSDEVTMVYRRGPQDMSASGHEQEWAQKNGVTIRHWATPKEVLSAGGLVTGVRFAATRMAAGTLVETGETFTLAADMVLKAIGQSFVAQPLGALVNLQGGRIQTDDQGRTSHAKVWAGGDCRVGGRDLTVEAVEHGKVAALSIHAALGANNGA